MYPVTGEFSIQKCAGNCEITKMRMAGEWVRTWIEGASVASNAGAMWLHRIFNWLHREHDFDMMGELKTERLVELRKTVDLRSICWRYSWRDCLAGM